MKNYFRLKKNCFIEMGINGAAIYDTNHENIYSIDIKIGKIIKDCMEGKPLETNLFNNSHKSNNILNYLNKIIKMGLGNYEDKYFAYEKIGPPGLEGKRAFLSNPLRLRHLWLELTRKCNLKCIHCSDPDMDDSISRCSCTRGDEKIKRLSDNSYLNLIADASRLGCKQIMFMGGEPFLEKELLFKLIKHSNKVDYDKITIKTNLGLFNNDVIDIIKIFNVGIDINIYSHDAKVHDLIVNSEGNWKMVTKTIRHLKQKGLRISANLEILKINQFDTDETISFYHKMGIDDIRIKFIYETKKALWPNRYSNIMHKNARDMSGVSKDLYFINKYRNPCWYGKLALSVDGRILPCIMAKKFVIGSVDNNPLKYYFEKRIIDKWWLASKGKIDICKHCEYKYTCFDCRPIESISNRLYGKNKYCHIYK